MSKREDNRIFQKILPPVPPHILWLSHVRKTITPNFFTSLHPFVTEEELFFCARLRGAVLPSSVTTVNLMYATILTLLLEPVLPYKIKNKVVLSPNFSTKSQY